MPLVARPVEHSPEYFLSAENPAAPAYDFVATPSASGRLVATARALLVGVVKKTAAKAGSSSHPSGRKLMERQADFVRTDVRTIR